MSITMTNPVAPKHIFKAILIGCASVCLFAPAAFAQRGGARGGGGSRGGSVGGARGGSGGSSHAGGGFRGGGAVHASGDFHGGGASHGPYGGSGVSEHFGGTSRMFPTPPARMSSGGGRSFGRGGFGSRGDFTGNSFLPPPAAARPVEGAARTIFIGASAASSPSMISTLNARPFAAGNYLWENPPSAPQRGRVVVPPPPPPVAPRPVPLPAAQPIRPFFLHPPSPMRPIAMPAPMPLAEPRPIQFLPPRPLMAPVTPIRGMGGRFIAPPIRGPRPVTPAPAPPLFHPRSLLGHPMPVPPVFGRIGLEPGASLGPSSLFMARGGSIATPPQPCIDTFAHCGIQNGFLDGDGDFDNDGFGFGSSFFLGFLGGPFGFSPLGFGSTCEFNGFSQECFLSPVEFSPFGIGPFGFNSFGFGAFSPFQPEWNSWGGGWGYAPYGSNLLYQPTNENAAWNTEENTPNTNYASAYFYEPAPEPLAQEQSSASRAIQNQKQTIVELALSDGTIFGVTSYWLAHDRLYYVTTYGIQTSISIGRLDLQKTVDLNWKRGVAFTLTPQIPEKQ